MLLLVTFFVRHNLTKNALVDLLKIINIILNEKVIPESHYKFTKYCSEFLKYKKHYYCGKCKLYLGELCNKIAKTFECTNCSDIDKKYFVSNSLSEILRDIIVKNFDSIIKYGQQLNQKVIGDISQGSVIDLVKNKVKPFFSISFNTDGIATFKSNIKKSLWPIIVTINELPPNIR